MRTYLNTIFAVISIVCFTCSCKKYTSPVNLVKGQNMTKGWEPTYKPIPLKCGEDFYKYYEAKNDSCLLLPEVCRNSKYFNPQIETVNSRLTEGGIKAEYHYARGSRVSDFNFVAAIKKEAGIYKVFLYHSIIFGNNYNGTPPCDVLTQPVTSPAQSADNALPTTGYIFIPIKDCLGSEYSNINTQSVIQIYLLGKEEPLLFSFKN